LNYEAEAATTRQAPRSQKEKRVNRIAKGLDVTTDYLLNGTMQDKSADAISDEELLSQFRKIEKLPDDKRNSLKSFSVHLYLKQICRSS
jgi:hypothetical protein